MKIANIIEDARIGGPQKRIVLVAQGLCKRYGFETVVMFPDWGGSEFECMLSENNISYKRFALTKLNSDIKGALKYLVTFLSEVRALSRYLSEADFDLIHASGGSWQYKAVIAAKWAGIPVVWHLNDTRINTIIKYIFNIVAKRYPDAFIVAGEKVQTYYLDNLSLKLPIYLIPAPVDTAIYKPLSSIIVEDNKSRYRLVCVGNVNPVKGYEYLLKALLILDEKNIKVDVDVCGGRFNSQADFIELIDGLASQLFNVRVKFHGLQKNTLPFLQGSDVFVCSSIAEASPMAVWEAMSVACPIVSTDVGDVSLHIDDGVSGIIVPPADPVALAVAIEKMLHDSDQSKIMGKQARERAEAELGIDKIVRLHALCYENILTVSN